MTIPTNPTWVDNVLPLFKTPYWVGDADGGDPAAVGEGWHKCMNPFLIDLWERDSVMSWAVTVYNHLHSYNMPMTSDPAELWPDDAVETFRLWVNQGCRASTDDPLDPKERIVSPASRPSPTPRPPPVPMKTIVRRDIVSLTTDELAQYQAAVVALGATSTDAARRWAQVGDIHTNWCLHYQEAFVLWHRAYMIYFESQLGHAVPYWNWMSPDIATDGSPSAGLPQAFRDLTYVHPETGEERPNPLRFAIARRGRSKACMVDPELPHVDGCQFVARDPVLYTIGDDQRHERQLKLDYLVRSQKAVLNALDWPRFSSPEIETAGGIPYPWANIPKFPAEDAEYPLKSDFDGLYEQPHDNFHGWVGPDMGDNTYTAYDPVFWSLHSNIDRIFEQWRSHHPDATFTVDFALRPFVGPAASNVDLAGREESVYTTIGDMFTSAENLGYSFGPTTDVVPVEPSTESPGHLYVLFPGVKCTHDSYMIDVFVNATTTAEHQPWATNPNYVGRLSRIGMGSDDLNGRCIAHSITRVLDATDNADALGIEPDSEVVLSQVVTDLSTHKVLSPDEYQALPGFLAHAVWGRPRSVVHETLR